MIECHCSCQDDKEDEGPAFLRCQHTIFVTDDFSTYDPQGEEVGDYQKNRIYRPAVTFEKLIDDIRELSGKKYDPEIAEILLKMLKRNA